MRLGQASDDPRPKDCYNRPLALGRFQQHDPHSEFLFPPPADAIEEAAGSKQAQRTLFDGLDES
jgi:hypothetical protein